eukprot:4912744-Amphidinium_carterae.1
MKEPMWPRSLRPLLVKFGGTYEYKDLIYHGFRRKESSSDKWDGGTDIASSLAVPVLYDIVNLLSPLLQAILACFSTWALSYSAHARTVVWESNVANNTSAEAKAQVLVSLRIITPPFLAVTPA